MHNISSYTCTSTLYTIHFQALEEEIASHRGHLASLASLSQSMSDTASPEDSLTLSDKMAQLKAAFEALERNTATRKRGLEDGLQQVIEIALFLANTCMYMFMYTCIQ